MNPVEISNNADIALLIGPHEVELRVSSKILETTKVFNTALHPTWPTGKAFQEHKSKGLSTLFPWPFEEHESEGMQLLCAALHNREDLIPEMLHMDDQSYKHGQR